MLDGVYPAKVRGWEAADEMVGSFGQIGICFQGGTLKITMLIPNGKAPCMYLLLICPVSSPIYSGYGAFALLSSSVKFHIEA